MTEILTKEGGHWVTLNRKMQEGEGFVCENSKRGLGDLPNVNLPFNQPQLGQLLNKGLHPKSPLYLKLPGTTLSLFVLPKSTNTKL